VSISNIKINIHFMTYSAVVVFIKEDGRVTYCKYKILAKIWIKPSYFPPHEQAISAIITSRNNCFDNGVETKVFELQD